MYFLPSINFHPLIIWTYFLLDGTAQEFRPINSGIFLILQIISSSLWPSWVLKDSTTMKWSSYLVFFTVDVEYIAISSASFRLIAHATIWNFLLLSSSRIAYYCDLIAKNMNIVLFMLELLPLLNDFLCTCEHGQGGKWCFYFFPPFSWWINLLRRKLLLLLLLLLWVGLFYMWVH